MFKKIASGFVAAIAVSAMVATPALATPVAYDGNDFEFGDVAEYAPSNTNFYLGDTTPTNAWETEFPQDDAYNANWDNHGALFVYDVDSDSDIYYDGVDLTTTCSQDTDGDDFLLSCDDEELISGLLVHPEYRTFGALNSERLTWIFTNDSDAEITVDASTEAWSECDADGYAEFSNGWTGEETVDNADINESNWMVQREEDSTDDECGVEAFTWQSGDGEVVADSQLNSNLDGITNTFTLTIPAGATQALVFFYGNAWIDDQNIGVTDHADPADPYVAGRQAAFDSAISVIEENFSELTEENMVGLDADLNVVNWVAPELAETGVDASGLALGAVALLVVGGAIAIRRRARA